VLIAGLLFNTVDQIKQMTSSLATTLATIDDLVDESGGTWISIRRAAFEG
jgi:hypothetical protein